MAFSEANKLKICKILRIDILRFNEQITYVGVYITAEVESQVVAEITRWATAGDKFVDIEPNVKNFGAKVQRDLEKDDIRSNIKTLLLFKDLDTGDSSDSFVIERG